MSTAPATYTQVEAPGLLRFSDADRIDFLQRQTTNDLRGLTPGRTVRTVLTNPLARILDVLDLIPDGDTLLAFTLPGYAQNTSGFLRKRIFFSDRVRLENLSDAWSQFLLDGPAAAEVLAALQFPVPALHTAAELPLGQEKGFILAQPGLAGVGYRLALPTAATSALAETLAQAGAQPLDAAAYDIHRIEAGLPAAGHEWTEEYTPLETRLEDAISHNKGCYTGQEVIARQITYDKVTKTLVGLRLSSPAPQGSAILAEDKPAGEITSAAHSPRFGPIALAVLKRPHHAPGTEVQVKTEAGSLRAEVCALPFTA